MLSHLVANSQSVKHSEFIKIVEVTELYSEYRDILMAVLKFCKVLKKYLNGKLKKREGEEPISKWIGGGAESQRIKVVFQQSP